MQVSTRSTGRALPRFKYMFGICNQAFKGRVGVRCKCHIGSFPENKSVPFGRFKPLKTSFSIEIKRNCTNGGNTPSKLQLKYVLSFYSNRKLSKADTQLHFHAFRGSESQLLAVMEVQGIAIAPDKRLVRSDKRAKRLQKVRPWGSGVEFVQVSSRYF